MTPALRAGRVKAIDAFRGLTFVVMVFVNELHGVSGLPAWVRRGGSSDSSRAGSTLPSCIRNASGYPSSVGSPSTTSRTRPPLSSSIPRWIAS